MDSNETQGELHTRTPGRRPVDSAHILKWVPFFSLAVLLLLHTIYVTRWGSGIEGNVTLLIQANAKLETKVEALTAAIAQGSVPSAQIQLRVDFIERQVNESRQTITDLTRRLSTVEVQGRAFRER